MTRTPWRGSVTSHRGRLLLKVKDDRGQWVQRSTGLEDTAENRAAAERLLAEVRNRAHALDDAGSSGGSPTVDRWGKRWLEMRKSRVRDHEHDESRFRVHIAPVIGHMRLDEVRPRHLVELFQAMKREGAAPRTIRNTYGVLRSMYRDARIADVFQGQHPCILTHHELGKVRDGKKGWRGGAVFTAPELVQLISDPRIPEDRRVQYAVLGLGMVRLGEMAGLRWACVQPAEPLGRIAVVTSYDHGETKTEDERWMPIHPTLASMLAAWRLSGWARTFGRPPTPDDIVLPVTPEPPRKGRKKPVGSMRDRHYVWKRAQRDLDALGLRRRRVHDLRRTGLSLAQDDGADKSILRWGTHAPPRDVMGLYTSLHWKTLCREVLKLQVSRATKLVVGGAPAPIPPGDRDA
jgi:integrase